MYKRALVEVWCVEDAEWTCRINEGLAGLVYARWAPDGRHILTTADFQLHVSIWSLVDSSIAYIKGPKLPVAGLAFSKSGRYLAVATRADCKDCVGIYDTDTWAEVNQFPVASKDLVDLQWAPDDINICIRDTALDYKVMVYAIDGRLVTSYTAYEHALGAKSTGWAPGGHFLAIGSYDGKVRLLNQYTWKSVAEYEHTPSLRSTSETQVYHEITAQEPAGAADAPEAADSEEKQPASRRTEKENLSASSSSARPERRRRRGTADSAADSVSETKSGPSTYMLVDAGASIHMPRLRSDPLEEDPRLGVGMLAWSNDSKFLVSRPGVCRARMAGIAFPLKSTD